MALCSASSASPASSSPLEACLAACIRWARAWAIALTSLSLLPSRNPRQHHANICSADTGQDGTAPTVPHISSFLRDVSRSPQSMGTAIALLSLLPVPSPTNPPRNTTRSAAAPSTGRWDCLWHLSTPVLLDSWSSKARQVVGFLGHHGYTIDVPHNLDPVSYTTTCSNTSRKVV
ncbi:uncharacterized protein BDR25DRAFT_98035 [Lindgomyces ingoldianus]|uniref:Uncharacterized protein n=1 Tax=Lindgomyces ingoldianus TaxID=673940 RepID=A0ACB6QBJ7_9PLEO|nr:uncharacterized protein BDR25DRAFT_98035 [Lindgomyces ingoldianus]KAF2464282.1 hypothetical protein BDR25DRAFT_98035 [Lindgomyces ingoldianus]